MTLTFYKYQGTGNDFIVVDHRNTFLDKNNTSRIAQLCDRRFGIGADGFILLEHHDDVDFKMVYYNANGHESTMCGNGGRCIVAFAKFLGIIKNQTCFMAIDGIHEAKIDNNKVSLQMQNVDTIEVFEKHFFLDTGSPHHVELVSDLAQIDVKSEGAKIRYGAPYYDNGSNVNFVEQLSKNTFKVKTYERGVEDETLSCGTGVTAVALAMHYSKKTNDNRVAIETSGGHLEIHFEKSDNIYNNIWLIGDAKQVFKGEVIW